MPHDIVRDPSLTCTEVRLWIIIFGHSDGYPLTISKLCEAAGVSRHTCLKTIANLEHRGLLKVTKNRGGKSSYKAVVTGAKIAPPKPTEKDGASGAKIAPVTSAEFAPVVVQKLHRGSAKIAPPTPYNIEKNILEEQFEKARDAHAREIELKNLVEKMFAQGVLIEQFCMAEKITVGEARKIADVIVAEWLLTNTTHIDESDTMRHLLNQIRIKAKYHRQDERNNTDKGNVARRGYEPMATTSQDYEGDF